MTKEKDLNNVLEIKAAEAIGKMELLVNSDPHRPLYHFAPPAGWMNDPNGLVFYKGEYHLFYQHWPYGANFGGATYWGHATSKDLLHWKHLPVALSPDSLYDRGGCYSGSAVEHNGMLALIYTGNIFEDVWVESNRKVQVQCLATSTDGIKFTKAALNPVISYPPQEGSADFRDPKVWRGEDCWYMVVGSGYKGYGKALLYSSDDLYQWTYLGVACESDGSQGCMWECPDLFPLGDKHVLIASPYGPFEDAVRKSIYILGTWDESAHSLKQESWEDLDHGHDFFAAQTYTDPQGRRILLAWMDMWDSPMPSSEYGWAGALTLPRLIECSAEGHLIQKPLPELESLRQKHYSYPSFEVVSASSRSWPELHHDAMEIEIVFDLSSCDASQFGIAVRCSKDRMEQTVVRYIVSQNRLEVDRTRSGQGKTGIKGCQLQAVENGTLKLQLFLDRSSLEVFANDGRAVFTNRIYPNPTSTEIELYALEGKVTVLSMAAWELAQELGA
ncbi:MAG: glycoside hydrolase family 32 protein [Gorillibacterium sp.]|nr:glycoside hydrolase family 32 protein [Gorillibacterium sp.]